MNHASKAPLIRAMIFSYQQLAKSFNINKWQQSIDRLVLCVYAAIGQRSEGINIELVNFAGVSRTFTSSFASTNVLIC